MTREEAIAVLETAKYELSNQVASKYCRAKYEAINMAIKALEQQPKTGHWIATGDYFTGAYSSIDYIKCSCCGYESLEEGNYCPNCGARMEN